MRASLTALRSGGCDGCDEYSCISASSWHHSKAGSSQLAASLEQPITQPITPLREHAHHLPHVPIGLGHEIQGFDQIPGLFAIQCQWRPVVAVQFQLPFPTEGNTQSTFVLGSMWLARARSANWNKSR